MQSIRRLFQKKEFHLFLFFVSMVLFNWPFLNIAAETQSYLFFVYIFSVWAIIILLSCLIARSHTFTTSDNDRADHKTAVQRER